MENNKLKSKIIEIVDNQIKINDPKCTKETLERLVKVGISGKRVEGINRESTSGRNVRYSKKSSSV